GRSWRPCRRCHAIRRSEKSGITGNAAALDAVGEVARGVKREGIEVLALAGGTEIGGTLTLHDLPDRRSADAAWQARAVIDEIVELEVAALPVAADEIAQRATTLLYRGGKRHAHGVREQGIAHQRDAARCGGRPDARAKQAFRRIDIAHADDDLTGQQRLLHRHRAPARE